VGWRAVIGDQEKVCGDVPPEPEPADEFRQWT